jgi:hypothetical protein
MCDAGAQQPAGWIDVISAQCRRYTLSYAEFRTEDTIGTKISDAQSERKARHEEDGMMWCGSEEVPRRGRYRNPDEQQGCDRTRSLCERGTILWMGWTGPKVANRMWWRRNVCVCGRVCVCAPERVRVCVCVCV